MRGVNKVILVGILGHDPSTRYSPEGVAVTNISVATSESWNDKKTGQKVENTEWHRVVMYSKLAEIAKEFLTKGSKVYIEGKLKTSKYTGKDGTEKTSTNIIASEMQMLSPRSDKAPGKTKEEIEWANKSTNNLDVNAIQDDDIPF